MRCPSLNDLPPPPPGKTGWPWTEESLQLPDTMPDGSPWPKISIVTPSFNQGQFIEETIRSVLLQGYPNLEYIIIDGGSDDGSAEIIEKYSPWLKYWVSEPDHGQVHAINKGFTKSSGNIYAYINSDDLYESGAFHVMAPLFAEPLRQNLVAGECTIFEENKSTRIFKPSWSPELSNLLMPFSSPFAQPASFWSKDIFETIGGIDESLHFSFDRDFFLRIALKNITPKLIENKIARFREHAHSKSVTQKINFYKESINIIQKHAISCGLSVHKKKKLINNVNNELKCIEIFIEWRNKGRLSAMRNLLRQISVDNHLIFNRKILAVARRLLFFKNENVAELKQFRST